MCVPDTYLVVNDGTSKSCIDATTCTGANGYIPASAPSTCVRCPSGKNCASCSSASSTKCLTCDSTRLLLSLGDGSDADGSCILKADCTYRYVQQSSDKTCILRSKCKDDYGYLVSPDYDNCIQCKASANCASCSNTDGCDTCKSGMVMDDNSQCKKSDDCAKTAGTAVLDDETCIDSSTCASIPGYLETSLDSDGNTLTSCYSCAKDANCASCKDKTHCYTCETDTSKSLFNYMLSDSSACVTKDYCEGMDVAHLILDGKNECVTAEWCSTTDGYFADLENKVCYECSGHNCLTCASATTCASCSGTYNLLDSDTSYCVDSATCTSGGKIVRDNAECIASDACKDGYVSGTVCTSCQNNCGTCSESSACIACDQTSEHKVMSADGTKCETVAECADGTHVVDKNLACIEASACADGYLDSTTSPTECLACSYRLDCATCSDQISCATCSAGSALTDVSSQGCVACDDAEYCPGGVAHAAKCGSCATCDNTKSAAGTCLTCPVGFKGEKCDTECVAGEWCPTTRGSTDPLLCATGCAACDSASAKPSKCIGCASGYKVDASDSSVCTACANTEYCADGKLVATCDKSCYRCSGSLETQCTSCYAGFGVDSDGKCTACAKNYHSNDDAVKCSPVSASEWAYVSNLSSEAESGGLSKGGVAAISIVCTLVVACAAFGLLYYFVFRTGAGAASSAAAASSASSAGAAANADDADGVQMDDMKNDDADGDSAL